MCVYNSTIHFTADCVFVERFSVYLCNLVLLLLVVVCWITLCAIQLISQVTEAYLCFECVLCLWLVLRDNIILSFGWHLNVSAASVVHLYYDLGHICAVPSFVTVMVGVRLCQILVHNVCFYFRYSFCRGLCMFVERFSVYLCNLVLLLLVVVCWITLCATQLISQVPEAYLCFEFVLCCESLVISTLLYGQAKHRELRVSK